MCFLPMPHIYHFDIFTKLIKNYAYLLSIPGVYKGPKDVPCLLSCLPCQIPLVGAVTNHCQMLLCPLVYHCSWHICSP